MGSMGSGQAGVDPELARQAHVRARLVPEAVNGGEHAIGVLGLDGDRQPRPVLTPHLRALGEAAVERVVRAPLVDRDGPQLGVGADDLLDELLAGVLRARERRALDVERTQHHAHVGRGQRIGRLEHGLPLLEPVGANLHARLDVDEAGAHLDRRVAARQHQVGLAALLDALGRKGVEAAIDVLAETLGERAPLPARDDGRGHAVASAFVFSASYSLWLIAPLLSSCWAFSISAAAPPFDEASRTRSSNWRFTASACLVLRSAMPSCWAIRYTSTPRNGSTIRKTTHAAFATPPMSRRRKTSVRITTIIQIQTTQAKKMIIDQRTPRNG